MKYSTKYYWLSRRTSERFKFVIELSLLIKQLMTANLRNSPANKCRHETTARAEFVQAHGLSVRANQMHFGVGRRHRADRYVRAVRIRTIRVCNWRIIERSSAIVRGEIIRTIYLWEALSLFEFVNQLQLMRRKNRHRLSFSLALHQFASLTGYLGLLQTYLIIKSVTRLARLS